MKYWNTILTTKTINIIKKISNRKFVRNANLHLFNIFEKIYYKNGNVIALNKYFMIRLIKH